MVFDIDPMIKKLFLVLITILCGACLFSSCTSPLNPDTPRIKIIEDGSVPPPNSAKISPKYFSINVKVNTAAWKNSIIDTLIVIDTATTPPSLWLDCDLYGTETSNTQIPFLKQFHFRVDSLFCNNATIALIGDPKIKSGASYVIGAKRDSSGIVQYSTIISEAQSSTASIQMLNNPSTKELYGQFHALLTNHSLEISAQIIIRY